jgi:hypothetical protein
MGATSRESVALKSILAYRFEDVDWKLLGYAALLWTGFHIFVLLYEEYRKLLPRWIPRSHSGRL